MAANVRQTFRTKKNLFSSKTNAPMTNMTPIRQVMEARSFRNQNDFDSWLLDNFDRLYNEEKQMIAEAMEFAFDEDGHSKSWRKGVIEKYYLEKYYEKSTQ